MLNEYRSKHYMTLLSAVAVLLAPVLSCGQESHVGNMTGHAAAGKKIYRRFCIYCHGERGDGQGENAPYLNPVPRELNPLPRDFTAAIFKCRSTVTGNLPTDEDLYDTLMRGLNSSAMPSWRALTKQDRVNLIAYIKSFSPRFKEEKPGPTVTIPPEPAVTMESIVHGSQLFQKMECWKCHGQAGRGDGPSASTLTDSKDQPIRPYNFAEGSRFKCGETNEDLYRIFITGLDGTPMPSFADVIKPNEAWDLVHFLRTLQVNRKSKENDILKAAGGHIPAPAAEGKGSGGGE